MKRPVFGVGSTLLLIAALALVGHADHGDDEHVEDLMEKIHEGKRSPYAKLVRQSEAPLPDWRVVEAALPRFAAMSRALLESKADDIKGSADGYVDSVEEIAAASKQRDAKAFRGGVESLRASCGDCHFKGGVGGELDD